MREQVQTWHRFTRYVIVSEAGSIQMELYREPQDEFGATAYIYALWIDEEHRCKGEAKKLLQRAEQIAKDAGHVAVFLEWKEADSPREVYQHLYLNTGYSEMASDQGYALLKKDLAK